MENKINIKGKLYNWAHIVFFIAGLFIILIVISAIIKPESGEIYDITAVMKKTEKVSLEKPESMDVLFVGNSESYRVYSPLQLYKEHGYASYNLGASALRLCDSREILSKTLKSQHPKVVILETDGFFEDGSPYRDENATVTNFVEKMLPVFHYHIFYKVFTPESKKGGAYADSKIFKGYEPTDTVEPYEGGDYMTEERSEVYINNVNRQTLLEIYNLCKENGATLILASSPSATNWSKYKRKAMIELLEELSINAEFLDFNVMLEELGIDWSTDTMDAGNHMNLSGSKKVTGWVGNYISENFDIEDHRGDKEYESWEENLGKAGIYND